MYSHMTVGSNDLARAKIFYDAVFQALGAEPAMTNQKGRLIYRHGGALFMVTSPIDGEPATPGNGMTIGFAIESEAQGDAWHKAGVGAGGAPIEDPPGRREREMGTIYLAYLRDPDGNKLCAMKRL